jgi:tRNA(Arg) A34 adenosine deaminase TadA
MARALAAARRAAARGEVPVGAVVTDSAGAVLAVSGNRVERDHDAAGHAELLAMRAAARKTANARLIGCDLWVTLEPCAMCAAAAGLFRVRRIVFAAYDPKGGGVTHNSRVFDTSTNAHRPEVIGGVMEQSAAQLLRNFFEQLRAKCDEI